MNSKKSINDREITTMTADTDTTFNLLRPNKFFTSIPDSDIRSLVPSVTEYSFKKGDYIFREGDSNKLLYIVAKGKVGIEASPDEGEGVILVVIEEDDYFGELELLDGLPRSAHAVALSDCRILGIDNSVFHSFLYANPTVGFNILQQLSLRLRITNKSVLSEHHRRSREKTEQLEKLHKLIDAAKIVNSSVNLDTVLELMLDTAIKSTDADRGTLYMVDHDANTLWSRMHHGETVGEIRLPVGKGIAGYVAQTGETVNIEDTYTHPYFNPEIDQRTGYHTHSMLCMPIRNKEKKILGIIQLLNKHEGLFSREDEEFIEAMSAHASLAIENARIATEIMQNERLLAVGRMASTIIHDLKSPLNAIKLYTKALEGTTGSGESLEMAQQVYLQADRLINMVQEILDYTKGIMRIETADVNVGDVLFGLYKFIGREFKEKNIMIDMDLGYEGIWRMDGEKMMRVFYNIAGNAADAMPRGGVFRISSSLSGEDLIISLSDNGTGMSAEVREKLFEPFFTHGKKHGTGLGMAIVRKIVEDHNGSIEVDTEEGKGTTFRIRLRKNM
jgi:signal transduction histidine kinase/CRP-like cAMP-binding protein